MSHSRAFLFLTIAVVVSFGLIGLGCQTNDTQNSEEESTMTASSTPTPVSTPDLTVTETEATGETYTNEEFGYEFSLPEGYLVIESSPHSNQDKVIVQAEDGVALCTIYTPPLETGFEVWDFSDSNKKEFTIPGSDKILYWAKGEPQDDSDVENSMILIEWGSHMGNRTADAYEESGLIIAEVSPDDTTTETLLEEIINSFRFL